VSGDTATGDDAASPPWYRALDRTQWNTLIASNLGWLFDGFETYGLVLTVGAALQQLLPAAEHPQIPAYAGTVIAITLLGWGLGGLLGGVLADYIGRKRMMIAAVLAYSLTSGLSALSFDWISFATLRFLVGVAIGSEWATGSSMIAELWPDRARGRGAGLMQCGLGLGFFLASLVWLVVGRLGPDAWRYMYLIGLAPALLTLWIRRAIPESQVWQRAAARRRLEPARFTLVDLFADRTLRRRTIVVFLMSLTSTVGFWGISTWVPPFVGSVAAAAGGNAAVWAGYAGMTFTLGAVVGYVGLGFLADRHGRKPVTILFFACALLLTPALFFGTRDPALLLLIAGVNGIFSSGQFTWMAAWLPELYPTRIRATALAFAFNGPRLIAFLGPLAAGALIVQFGGYGQAAMVLALIYLVGMAAAPLLPETVGRPLPA
jgi:MFS family permease